MVQTQDIRRTVPASPLEGGPLLPPEADPVRDAKLPEHARPCVLSRPHRARVLEFEPRLPRGAPHGVGPLERPLSVQPHAARNRIVVLVQERAGKV